MTSKPEVIEVNDLSAVSTREAFSASNGMRDQQLAANQARTEAPFMEAAITRVVAF
jgi:hypothetical protein